MLRKAANQSDKMFSNEADRKYQKAINFYKSGNFIEAKRKFIETEAIFPGYKATRNYLSKIDKDIERELKRRSKDSQRIQRSQKQWDPDIFEKRLKEEKVSSYFQNEAKGIYNQAINHFEDKQYNLSKEKFIQVNLLVPDYKQTKRYIQRIDQRIENQRRHPSPNEKIKQVMDDKRREKKEALKRERLAKLKEKQELKLRIKEEAKTLRDQHREKKGCQKERTNKTKRTKTD